MHTSQGLEAESGNTSFEILASATASRWVPVYTCCDCQHGVDAYVIATGLVMVLLLCDKQGQKGNVPEQVPHHHSPCVVLPESRSVPASAQQ